MELSIRGGRAEARGDRQYTLINKLYNLLEGDKCILHFFSLSSDATV